MTRGAAASRINVILAWVAVALMALFIILGVVWYAGTPDVGQRIWENLKARPTGPMAFRFILQPLMAAIVAAHDGFEDARLGRTPFFWTVLSDPEKRGRRLREGLVATGRIILLGLLVDVIYQYVVLHTLYPGEAVLVALLLALLPYFLLRGPAARIARLWVRRPAHGRKE